mmetsp:Transcript_19523/g.40151  ORF Transcript_19523/g.40151 Transcript_19523/m.40151 type:complete len:434 (-) Transcript_19523:20-1321(-)
MFLRSGRIRFGTVPDLPRGRIQVWIVYKVSTPDLTKDIARGNDLHHPRDLVFAVSRKGRLKWRKIFAISNCDKGLVSIRFETINVHERSLGLVEPCLVICRSVASLVGRIKDCDGFVFDNLVGHPARCSSLLHVRDILVAAVLPLAALPPELKCGNDQSQLWIVSEFLSNAFCVLFRVFAINKVVHDGFVELIAGPKIHINVQNVRRLDFRKGKIPKFVDRKFVPGAVGLGIQNGHRDGCCFGGSFYATIHFPQFLQNIIECCIGIYRNRHGVLVMLTPLLVSVSVAVMFQHPQAIVGNLRDQGNGNLVGRFQLIAFGSLLRKLPKGWNIKSRRTANGSRNILVLFFSFDILSESRNLLFQEAMQELRVPSSSSSKLSDLQSHPGSHKSPRYKDKHQTEYRQPRLGKIILAGVAFNQGHSLLVLLSLLFMGFR